MSKITFFYCNANRQVGYGHLSRCLNIAYAISSVDEKQNIIFIGIYDSYAQEQIATVNYLVSRELPKEPVLDSKVIIDSYKFKESQLRDFKFLFTKLIVIDDFFNIQSSLIDLSINFRHFGKEKPAGFKSKKSCLGLDYFPNKPAFKSIREKNIKKQSVSIKKVLVSVGGVNANQIDLTLTKLVDQILINKEIICLGRNIFDYTSIRNKITLIDFCSNIEFLYDAADCILSGGGITKYEAGFCITPNAALSQTREQKQDTEILARSHLCFDLGDCNDNKKSIAIKLSKFLLDEDLSRQIESMKQLFDTHSLKNLAYEIINL